MAAPDYKTPERAPVISLMDFCQMRDIPDDEAREAYQDGAEGLPCGNNRDRAYWHAWRQGAADHKKREQDIYDRLLAQEVRTHGGLVAFGEKIKWMRGLLANRPICEEAS